MDGATALGIQPGGIQRPSFRKNVGKRLKKEEECLMSSPEHHPAWGIQEPSFRKIGKLG